MSCPQGCIQGYLSYAGGNVGEIRRCYACKPKKTKVFKSEHLYVPRMQQEFIARIIFYLIGQLSVILLFAIWYLMFEFTGIIRAIIIFSAMVTMLLFSLVFQKGD